MRIPALFVLISTALMTSACGQKGTSAEDYYSTPVKLPDGTIILAEQMRTRQEMMRGMMFRDEMKPGRGMIFWHGSPGKYPYWMYQVKVPLDIIWIDINRRIVEISPQTPPCPVGVLASKCPQYGGNKEALFVVELAGGAAAKHGLKLGDTLGF